MEHRIAMHPSSAPPVARRTLLVIAALAASAVLSFAAVSRLVTRLKANEKRFAWRAYEAGLNQVRSGRPELALDDFRAALSYDRDNPAYQLRLWSATPEDSAVNLALARLAVRRHSLDDAIRYYHSAIYGFWPSDPNQNRRDTRLELIDFLLQQNALPQAQAELIALTQVLPPDPQPHLQVAALFLRAQDLPNALAQYKAALKTSPRNFEALAGAGTTAFQMGRYRTAFSYLQKAVAANSNDPEAQALLQTAAAVLSADPFMGRLSDAERNRRILAAFRRAGTRLVSCARAKQIHLPPAPAHSKAPASPPAGDDLPSLWARWQSAWPQLRHLKAPSNEDLPDALMDLVFTIEQQTRRQCGEPAGLDRALLLMASNRETADQ